MRKNYKLLLAIGIKIVTAIAIDRAQFIADRRKKEKAESYYYYLCKDQDLIKYPIRPWTDHAYTKRGLGEMKMTMPPFFRLPTKAIQPQIIEIGCGE
jgi:hypothetical protein